MEYFFRTEPDAGFSFNMHLVRLGLILFLILIYKMRKKTWLLKSLLVASVILQTTLYLWYTQDHDLLIREGLPLYHCRIAGIFLPISFFIKKEKMMAYFADLALIGTLVAFAVPDPSPYSWPHITNLTYITNHYVLMACGMLVTLTYPTKIGFKTIACLSFAMNLIIFILDLILGANYGYLIRVPIEFFARVPSILVFLIMTLLIILIIYLIEKIKANLRDKATEISICN